MDVPTYILNHKAVIDFFGLWPSFHDATVPTYEAPRPETQSLSFTLHTWQMTDEVDAKSFFVLWNHALVSFRFDGIHDVKTEAFKSGNILFGLEFFRTAIRLRFASSLILSWICPAHSRLARRGCFDYPMYIRRKRGLTHHWSQRRLRLPFRFRGSRCGAWRSTPSYLSLPYEAIGQGNLKK
jgi:hypothetical protein